MGPAEPKMIAPTAEKAVCMEVHEDATHGTIQDNTELSYSILSEKEKVFTVCLSSMATFLAPVAANMYLTALGPLARDMHVSNYKISLTITVFKIVQAFAPLLPANYSDRNGRRPILIVSVLIFLASNIGLALQTNYAALLVLRCLQALGSSIIVPVAYAAVADLIPRAERGKYMFYSSLGMTVGPAIGPTLGGVLTQFLGWRSIFWFLAISAGVIICFIVLFLRETCRAVVGNGSVPPPFWNRSILQLLRPEKQDEQKFEIQETTTQRPTIFDTLLMVFDRHVGLLVVCSAVSMGGSSMILSTLPLLLERKYELNPLQVGLCFLPFTLGGIVTRWNVGLALDWNFKRHALKVGEAIRSNQEIRNDPRGMPLEKARLQLALPSLYLSCLSVIAYGWVMDYEVHLACPLVVLFIVGNTTTAVNNCIVNLLIDLNSHRPAAANASMSTFRNLAAAGGVAAAVPLIDAMGIGWVGILIAAVYCLGSPTLWALYIKGQHWRQKEFTSED